MVVYRQITDVYGNVMNKASVQNSASCLIHHKHRQIRQPSVVLMEAKIEEELHEDSNFTIASIKFKSN